MKRKDLLRHLRDEGCVLSREGAKHSVFFNKESRTTSTVPRHAEIKDFLVKKICRDLGIREIK